MIEEENESKIAEEETHDTSAFVLLDVSESCQPTITSQYTSTMWHVLQCKLN